jgi:pimeloyl-ACP methyl ester carboxylesterase
MSSEEYDTVVVAVHGTWASGAPWAQANSFLHTSLTSAFDQRLHWLNFDWSGTNSHRARHAAASELRAKLEQIATNYPKARIFVIAHSHGGNIALMALASSGRLRSRIHGVVCLSTPFVLVEPQNLEHLNNIAGVFFPLLFFAVLPLASLAVAVLMMIALDVRGLVLLFPVFWWFGGKYLHRVFDRGDTSDQALTRRQTELAKRYDYSAVKTPILVLRTTLDEAFLVVRTFSALGAGPVQAHGFLEKLFFLFVGLCMLLLILTPVSCAVGATANWLGLPQLHSLNMHHVVPFFLHVIPAVIGAALAVQLLFLGVNAWRSALRAGPWSWGESIVDGLIARFSVSTLPPPGLRAVNRVLRASTDDDASLLKLRHSSMYASLEASQVIAAFLRDPKAADALDSERGGA